MKTETQKGGVISAKLPGGRGIALSNIPQGSKIATCQKRVGALKAHETCYIHCEHKSQLFILGIRSRAKFSPQEGKKKKKTHEVSGRSVTEMVDTAPLPSWGRYLVPIQVTALPLPKHVVHATFRNPGVSFNKCGNRGLVRRRDLLNTGPHNELNPNLLTYSTRFL